jgi:hypothetical protein
LTDLAQDAQGAQGAQVTEYVDFSSEIIFLQSSKQRFQDPSKKQYLYENEKGYDADG